MKPPPARTPWPKTVADFLQTAGFQWEFSFWNAPCWRNELTGLFVTAIYDDDHGPLWALSRPIGQPGFVQTGLYRDFGQVASLIVCQQLQLIG